MRTAGPGMQWLEQHGKHVTSLSLERFEKEHPQPLRQLPCPNLLELTLRYGIVQLGPAADGHPGLVQSCSKLTRLSLWCNSTNSPWGVAADSLSSLAQLVHLRSCDVNFADSDSILMSNDTLPFIDRLTHGYMWAVCLLRTLPNWGC